MTYRQYLGHYWYHFLYSIGVAAWIDFLRAKKYGEVIERFKRYQGRASTRNVPGQTRYQLMLWVILRIDMNERERLGSNVGLISPDNPRQRFEMLGYLYTTRTDMAQVLQNVLSVFVEHERRIQLAREFTIRCCTGSSQIDRGIV